MIASAHDAAVGIDIERNRTDCDVGLLTDHLPSSGERALISVVLMRQRIARS